MNRNVKIFLLTLLIVLALGAVVVVLWRNKKNSAVPLTPSSTIEQSINNASQKINEISKTDQDVDGLTDNQEKQYGTSPTNSDTDGDGLLDKDEIMNYKTDPLKADTDGDGMLDGSEVLRKRNPLQKN
jgi:uncharacterized protein HemX